MLPRRVRRLLAPASAIVAMAVVALLVLGREDGPDRTFSVVVPEATGLVTSQRVTDGSEDVGTIERISPVRGGRAARLTIRISDPGSWPIRSTSRIEIRLGGTVSFSNRYAYLRRGRGGRVVPPGGTLPSGNVKIPVEADALVNQLTPPVRRGIAATIRRSSAVLEAGGASLNHGLRRTPRLTRNLSGVFQDLDQDRRMLVDLVGSADRVVDAVARSTPDVRVLLDGLASTVDAVDARSQDLRTGLTRLPAALRQTRETLGRARSTLGRAADLTDALAPGVRQLRRTALPLTQTLQRLQDVTPLALAALDAPQRKALNQGSALLRSLGSVSPRLTSILTQAHATVGCIRPWIPEIAGFGATWGDWMSPVDERDHLIRAQVQSFLPIPQNSSPYTAEDATKLFEGVTYGFPRPPGELADQPWFQPQCGVTEDALDPSKDQEAKTFKKNLLPPEVRP